MFRSLKALIATVRDPQFRGLVVAVGALLTSGTVFYWINEDWTLIDSFYFSTMTLLTVGYGDFVPSDALSKLFTIVYTLLGAGVLLAFVSIVARRAGHQPPSDGPDSD